MEDEDEKLCEQIHTAVFEDVKPQSFLEKLAVRDFADKLFDELRLKAAMVGLIDGARQTVAFEPKEEREFRAIQLSLPNWQKLHRMKDNSETACRSIMKEFRRKAASSKATDDPETSAKGKKPN